MHVGSEGWPVWSNQTGELLLVLIAGCQDTQCIVLFETAKGNLHNNGWCSFRDQKSTSFL